MRTSAEICDDYIEKFTELVKDLWVMSETDAEMTPLVWKNISRLTDSILQKKANTGKGTAIEKWTAEEFFKNKMKAQDWHSPEEAKTAIRFSALLDALHESLTELAVYKIGDARKVVFIVGKLTDRTYAGLSTYVVET
ncbi:MAG: nuclease A inhibitor family protein [Saprospiraceae bacterium]